MASIVHRGFMKLAAGLLLLGMSPGYAQENRSPGFPPASELPSRAELPDPLVMLDGSRVTTPEQWRTRRRPELKALFQHYMYGRLPARPRAAVVESSWQDSSFLQGQAVISEETIAFQGPDLPQRLRVLTIRPKQAGPVPAFVAMNFCGNHAVVNHPKIAIPTTWVYNSCAGVEKERATEKGRGGQADVWNVDLIVQRGYALVSFYSGDIDPDTPDFADGIEPYFLPAGQTGPKADDAGAIAAWAWGYHRVADHLLERHAEQFTQERGLIAVGHSRNGKTALLAAAMDERFAIAMPHQAGCGGTAPSRGKVGESVKQINDRFPHWFCDAFTAFNDDPTKLPFDQHSLVALCAPRPVLFTNAQEDQWANPDGQFEMLRAAEPVYQLLQVSGLVSPSRPALGKLAAGRLGYFIRDGKHSMNRVDWQAFLDYADAQLPKPQP
ncbi:MAG: acetylxylan esterase [Planctomycetota bacterium]